MYTFQRFMTIERIIRLWIGELKGVVYVAVPPTPQILYFLKERGIMKANTCRLVLNLVILVELGVGSMNMADYETKGKAMKTFFFSYSLSSSR